MNKTTLETQIETFRTTRPGSDNRRAYVGPPAQYDFMGATQFNLLTRLGLREEHVVVDIGCGSLRAGRYLINYLLPGRYVGIEPNAWLWQEAFDQEIGSDLLRLKQPRFEAEADFSLSAVDTDSVDFVVAQSIYSHTGADLFTRSVGAVARCLRRNGQFLFTVVSAGNPGIDTMPRGADEAGWIYPACVSYSEDEALATCREAGLFVQKLDWFHPRQTWFRATHDPALVLTPEMMTALGTGKPLFDPRF